MRGRRARLRVLGAALVLYGMVGIAIFILVGIGVARPLDRAATLSASVDSDRQALVESLSQAELTIREMSTGVGRMDTSLADAKTAIDKAATISHGIAASMYSLRDAMNVNILGAQPLSGLSGSFDTSGQNLDALGDDISTIGTSLDANRSDVVATAEPQCPRRFRSCADGDGRERTLLWDRSADPRFRPARDLRHRHLDGAARVGLRCAGHLPAAPRRAASDGLVTAFTARVEGILVLDQAVPLEPSGAQEAQ